MEEAGGGRVDVAGGLLHQQLLLLLFLKNTSATLSFPFFPVPGASPESISITTFQDANGTVIIHWEPPPQDMHNGIIKGYQVRRNGIGAIWVPHYLVGGDGKKESGGRMIKWYSTKVW